VHVIRRGIPSGCQKADNLDSLADLPRLCLHRLPSILGMLIECIVSVMLHTTEWGNMRVNKWGVSLVLAASVLLTGCTAGGADEPAAKKPTQTTEETTAPKSDCPELTEGATIDGAALGACITDAMADSAGYAAKTSVMGIESTARYNPADDAVESISSVGSLIVIGDQIWVKTPTSDWVVGDPSSSDPMIAALSSGAATVAQTDPAATAAALVGEFTVTSKGSRLGQDVYVVTGKTEQSGVSVDITFEVTQDFVTLATTSTGEVAGQSVEVVMEITEWDVAQDIVAPL
jgi:hypothetical protein